MKKRVLSVLLAIVMVVGMFPVTAGAQPAPHNHPICGATCSHTDNGDHSNISWTAWSSTNSLPTSAGNYYLTANVTINNTWSPKDGTVLCLNGKTITKNNSDSYNNSHAISIGASVTFTLTDCQSAAGTITHGDESYKGCGVELYGSAAVFNMYGGAISGNTNAYYGGGVEIESGIFNMYGGTISNNTANYGGGVYVNKNQEFNMYGGTISSNTASHNGGGGVYVSISTFNMYGGTISSNNATNTSTTVNVGCGGGVYISGDSGSAVVNMTGGTISGNTSANYGGGVYVYSSSTFNVSGSPVITGNTTSTDTNADNVYLKSSKKVTLTGALSAEAQIGVTLERTTSTFTANWNTYMPDVTNYEEYFSSDNSAYGIIKNDNELYLQTIVSVTGVTLNKSSATLEVNGTEMLTATLKPDNATNKTVSWISSDPSVATVEDGVVTAVAPGEATITATTADGNFTDTCTVSVSAPAETHKHDMSVACGGSGVTFEPWGGTTTFPGGNVYLTKDVTLADTLTISSGTVNLCLNGHNITNSSAAIEVKSGATLNICDCGSGGTVSATASGSRGINNSGTVNVYGGTVIGNTYGIASNSSGSNVTVSGGTVSGGTGIENYGTLTVSGGSVTGTYDYGGYGISSYGTLKLSGAPTITGGSNSADVLIHAYQKVITIDGTLTYSTPISVEPYNGYSAFTEGWNDKMPTADHNDYFIPASGSYVFVESSDELKPAYTVTYDANGAASGSVPVDSSSPYFYSNGVTVLGNTDGLAKEGYEFSGWNTKADGTGTHYAPDSTFTIYSNTTLYAVWKVPHIHEYTYSATDNVITESCTCGHSETATLQLDANATLKYTGSAITPITVTYSDGWEGEEKTNADIVYTDNIDAGTATATLTIDGVDGVSAEITFVIKPASVPDIPFPSAVNPITYGQALEDAVLTFTSNAYGTFNWVDPNGVPNAGTAHYAVDFTPNEQAMQNYAWASDSRWITSRKTLCVSVEVVVNKADQAAPAVNKEDETISGKNDGKITDVTANMEYRAEGEDRYTAITGETVENLADGKYYVRVKGDSNHNPSEDTDVVIGAGRMLTVTVPQNPIGYTVTVNKTEMEYEGSYTLKVEINEGYTATEDFKIIISSCACGQQAGVEETYMNAIADQIIEVQGVADITAPAAKIEVAENGWTTFLNTITFGQFFKENQNVTISATDLGSGVNSIEYYIANGEMTLDAVKAITAWEGYNGTFRINPDNQYVIYAKVTDNAGNITYISSDGLVLDATAPALFGIENNGVYYGDKIFKAIDDHFLKIEIDGIDVTDTTQGDDEYKVTADNAEHTVTVTDKAGNVTEYKITVYKNYTVTFKVDGATVDTQTVGYGKDATAPSIPAKDGYTQTAPTWDKDGKNITVDTEINAVYTINKYTVTFNSNGGNKVDGIPDVIHGTVITEPTAPAKENATFAGWFSDSDCTKAWNFAKDTVTADLTLYAKWSDVPVFHISGKVLEKTGDGENDTGGVPNANVKLMLGTTLIATETTDENGLFYFGGQIAGDYNLVVEYGEPQNQKTVTVLVAIHGNDAEGLEVTLPASVTNSIVKHEPAADGKDSVAAGTLVGGLEDVAAAVRSENQNAQKVEVKLTVADQPPVTGTPTAGTEAAKQQAQQKAIQQKAGGKQLVFFDLSVVKTIDNGTPEAITDTGATLLEIRIPFDSGNKWGITIYRYHGDKAEVLAAVREGSTTEGFWVGDDGYIHIYTHKFSTYAVGYTVPSYGYFVPVTPDTVTSADTFDAGIVVYVTMSMLAATGSAVVIGKKRKEEN